MRILFLGDIVGRPGREGVAKVLPAWLQEHQPHFAIANAENAAGGVGLTPDLANELFALGIDAITLGNHAFNKREIVPMLETDARLIRPANYPPEVPGKGWSTYSPHTRGGDLLPDLAVISLGGRVFMEHFDDPFRAIDSILSRLSTPCVFIDFHAEATSEKVAFGFYVDGRASAVVGTHTHVQTADERVLPGGTAYLSDVGMCGPIDSVIGMDRSIVIKKFLTQMPARFEVAEGEALICGVLIDLDERSGKARSIKRLQKRAQ